VITAIYRNYQLNYSRTHTPTAPPYVVRGLFKFRPTLDMNPSPSGHKTDLTTINKFRTTARN